MLSEHLGKHHQIKLERGKEEEEEEEEEEEMSSINPRKRRKPRDSGNKGNKLMRENNGGQEGEDTASSCI